MTHSCGDSAADDSSVQNKMWCRRFKYWGSQVGTTLGVVSHEFPSQLVTVDIVLFFERQLVVVIQVLMSFDMPILEAYVLTKFGSLGNRQVDVSIIAGGVIGSEWARGL